MPARRERLCLAMLLVLLPMLIFDTDAPRVTRHDADARCADTLRDADFMLFFAAYFWRY